MDFKRDYMAFFPENPTELGLNELTMQFAGEAEEEYLNRKMESFLSKKRLGLIIGIFIFSIFAISDLLLASESMGSLLFLRFGVSAALLFMTLALSYVDKARVHFRKLILAVVIIMSLSHLFAFSKLPVGLIPRYHFSYLILVIYTSLIMSVGFLYSGAAAAMSVLFYIGFISFSPTIQAGDKLLFSIVAIMLLFMILIVTYYGEYLARRNYVLENRKARPSDSEDKKNKNAKAANNKGVNFERGKIRQEEEKRFKAREEAYRLELEEEKKKYELLQKEFEALQIGEYERYSNLEREKLREEFAEGINVNDEKLRELEVRNNSLMSDIDRLMAENKALKDGKDIKILDKSMDDIRLMGRMGTFASNTMVKNLVENLNYFEEHEAEFSLSSSVNHFNASKLKIRENLYLAAGVQYRFELFRRVLECEGSQQNNTDMAAAIQRAFSQLIKYFEGTQHLVDVTCKDGIMVRMNPDSLNLVLQNLVMSSLTYSTRTGNPANIFINVREEKSKVILEYEDGGRANSAYYNEILKMDEINSNIISVSGIEIYLIRELVRKETGGDVVIDNKLGTNKLVMSFIK